MNLSFLAKRIPRLHPATRLLIERRKNARTKETRRREERRRNVKKKRPGECTYRTSQAALIFRNARRVRGYAGEGIYEEYAAARPRGRQRPRNDGVARRVTVDVLATLSATSFVSFPFHFQL